MTGQDEASQVTGLQSTAVQGTDKVGKHVAGSQAVGAQGPDGTIVGGQVLQFAGVVIPGANGQIEQSFAFGVTTGHFELSQGKAGTEIVTGVQAIGGAGVIGSTGIVGTVEGAVHPGPNKGGVIVAISTANSV